MMADRKRLNPFSIGIKKSEQYISDYFYREMFIRFFLYFFEFLRKNLFLSDSETEKDKNKLEENLDEEIIDCVGGGVDLNEYIDDEVIKINPADEFAEAVCSVMKNASYSFDEGDEDFLKIANERFYFFYFRKFFF